MVREILSTFLCNLMARNGFARCSFCTVIGWSPPQPTKLAAWSFGRKPIKKLTRPRAKERACIRFLRPPAPYAVCLQNGCLRSNFCSSRALPISPQTFGCLRGITFRNPPCRCWIGSLKMQTPRLRLRHAKSRPCDWHRTKRWHFSPRCRRIKTKRPACAQAQTHDIGAPPGNLHWN